MDYLHWDEKVITDFSDTAISDLYARGYVFTRIGKGAMQQTRSSRIDLSAFELSSENRRILKKISDLVLKENTIPYAGYDFTIGKLGKDFYDTKFGSGIMSAQKIKEMLTDSTKSNFTTLLTYGVTGHVIGYVIAYKNKDIMHYSYPFYDLTASKDTGLGMMTQAIQHAKEQGLKYIYLGSLQRPSDTYKLQFKGLERFDGHSWKTDLEEVKNILK